ncbi:MAG: ABC transporter permease [Peptococcaceae bacterium]|nr:ABC transporter permease [Peptococcaceae bacterium]
MNVIAKKNVEPEQVEFKKRSQWGGVWLRFKRNKLAVFGLCLFIVLAVLALSADLIADYEMDVVTQNIKNRYQPSSTDHLFGTDQYGRDVFGRIIFGARISISIGLVAVASSVLIGAICGSAAAYYGGKVDAVLMRIMDAFLAIPSTLLAIAIVSALGSSVVNLVLAMSVSQIPKMARLIRSSVLGIMGQEFIEAARACGTSDARIILRHILPNAVGPLIVQTMQTVAGTILTIASLSFIGLGIQSPTPEWGTMLSEARPVMRYYPMLAIYPGIAIMLTVMSLTLIGDGLRDALDPRLKN